MIFELGQYFFIFFFLYLFICLQIYLQKGHARN